MRTAALMFLLLLPAAPAGAADNAVSLAVSPPAGKLDLAEPFTFRVEASLPESYSIKPDTAAAGNSEFEVRSFVRRAVKKEGGRRSETFEIEAKPFTLGVSTFPALAWQLSGGGVPPGTVIRSSTFTVEVLPLFEATEGQDIRDIYKPYGYIPWLLLAAALALAALGAWLYRRFRGGSAGAPRGAAWTDARSPYQRARDRLDRFAKTGLAPAGKMKEYYTGLTSILRLYLQEEFSIDAALMTTADLSREIKRTGAELRTALKAREFLQKADLVKFARLHPGDAAKDSAALSELLMEFHRARENALALEAAANAAAELAARRGGRP
jgi:hypothetical protein